MKLEDFSKEHLIKLLKRSCCHCIKPYPPDWHKYTFKENEYYFMKHDGDEVIISTDDWVDLPFTYEEADEYFDELQ